MKLTILLSGAVFLLTACSSSVDVDAGATLPGSWLCDDGIVITFDTDSSYEWRVPSHGVVALYTESNDYIRMNDDGGYTILGDWRLRDGFLDMDMLGETDRYKLEFSSETSFRIAGPDAFSCDRH